MMDDLNRLRSMVQRIYSRILQRPIELMVLIGYVIYLNRPLGFFLLACLVPLGLVLTRVVGKIKRRSKKARAALSENLTTFEQITSGIRVIKAMGSAERERERFTGTNQALYEKLMRVARSRAQSESLTFAAIFALVALTFILHRLRRVAATLVAGDPFVPENAGHLRAIAFATAGYQLISYAGNAVLGLLITIFGTPIRGGADLDPGFDLNLGVWFAVLALFVLAEVFREGTRLREEQKLTI